MIHYFSNLNPDTAMALLFPILIWTVMLAFLWSTMVALCDGVKHLQKLHRIPCDRCQYYTGTHYLKCPVHPMTALSEDAIDCHDFAPIADCQTQPCNRRPANNKQVVSH